MIVVQHVAIVHRIVLQNVNVKTLRWQAHAHFVVLMLMMVLEYHQMILAVALSPEKTE